VARCYVGIDYDVEMADFYYSVSHALIRDQVDTRASAALAPSRLGRAQHAWHETRKQAKKSP
jgi:hypothetical protein